MEGDHVQADRVFIKLERVFVQSPALQISPPYHLNPRSGVRKFLLNDISLELRDGDFIGLTGSNGAGKTTLLRVIAGIIPASLGNVTSNCTISPFISNLWASSSSHLTALDQARKAYYTLYGTRSLPPLDEFLESMSQNALLSSEQLKLPVAYLSRGMRTRLSFGISSALKSEVMVIDEGLGTGDKRFQKHAKRVLEHIRSSCKALVLATHSKSLMQRLCNKVIHLEAGSIQSQYALNYHE